MLGHVLHGHRRLAAGLVVVVVLVTAGLLRLSPLWPGPSLLPDATALSLATEPADLTPVTACATALLMPARVTVEADALVLVPEAGGDPIKVVWPAGWAAWRRAGRAELVARDGTVVGREGDILSGFGGGLGPDGRFHVCLIGG
jgi:hypothetical protein